MKKFFLGFFSNFFLVYWFLPVLVVVLIIYFIDLLFYGNCKYEDEMKFSVLFLAVFWSILLGVSIMYIYLVEGFVLSFFWLLICLLCVLMLYGLRVTIIRNIPLDSNFTITFDFSGFLPARAEIRGFLISLAVCLVFTLLSLLLQYYFNI